MTDAPLVHVHPIVHAIKQAMRKKGWTQQYLGDQSGVNSAYLSNLFNGTGGGHNPTLSTLGKLAAVVDLEIVAIDKGAPFLKTTPAPAKPAALPTTEANPGDWVLVRAKVDDGPTTVPIPDDSAMLVLRGKNDPRYVVVLRDEILGATESPAPTEPPPGTIVQVKASYRDGTIYVYQRVGDSWYRTGRLNPYRWEYIVSQGEIHELS